ncbi:hypothetical protein [Blastococcus sp. SYSU DS0973]
MGPGDTVGMSGFTGAGYPKPVPEAVPEALARRISSAHAAGEAFRVNVWTGASTAPELDGVLAAADGVDLRLPYQSDPVTRAKMNAGETDYLDVHLSHVAQLAWEEVPRAAGRRRRRGQRHHRRRRPRAVVLDRQQQDLARPRRAGGPRGELLAERRPRGHARHLLRHRPPPEPAADPAHRAGRPDRRAASAVRAGEDRRDRRDARTGPEQPAGRPRPDVAADRRAPGGVPRARGGPGAPARRTASPPVRGGQRGQRRTGRPGVLPLPGAVGVHRGDPGRHARAAGLGHALIGLRDRLLPGPGGRGGVQRLGRRLP